MMTDTVTDSMTDTATDPATHPPTDPGLTGTHHWTPLVQRAFLEALSYLGTVREACAVVGKTWRSAYNLRARAEGRAFHLGWEAALLLARAPLVDGLMERALHGQTETVERTGESRAESTKTRHYHQNRVAMSLLARLDQRADALPGKEAAPIRIIAQDFSTFLDLVEAGSHANAINRFLEDRADLRWPTGHPDLSPPGRRALFPDPFKRPCGMVWHDEHLDRWQTDYPVPPGFAGAEQGTYGEIEYARDLTPAEFEVFVRKADVRLTRKWRTETAARDAFFGFDPNVPAAVPAPQRPPKPAKIPYKALQRFAKQRNEARRLAMTQGAG
jgi:hypothetical protein